MKIATPEMMNISWSGFTWRIKNYELREADCHYNGGIIVVIQNINFLTNPQKIASEKIFRKNLYEDSGSGPEWQIYRSIISSPIFTRLR